MLAQAKVQFFPSLTGRTGPVAPNATPFANGYADYMKLVNVRGGINGVQTLVKRMISKEDVPVIIQADKEAPAGLLVRIIDESKLAGASKVSIASAKGG